MKTRARFTTLGSMLLGVCRGESSLTNGFGFQNSEQAVLSRSAQKVVIWIGYDAAFPKNFPGKICF